MSTQVVPAERLVDHFIIVGTGPKLIPIDDAPAGSSSGDASLSASLPPPPRSYMDRLYRGSVLSRFPSVEHASVPFDPSLTIFAIPDSISLTHSQSELPILYYFAATQGNGSRLYGACLRFYELVPPEAVEVLEEQERLAQQSLHSISAENQRRTIAASTTESANERESNPLSRLHGDLHNEYAYEHSVSAVEHSVTRKKHSRSSSPTQQHAVHIHDASSSPSSSPTAGGSASPPRPARSGITLDSFAPILPVHRSASVAMRPTASTSGLQVPSSTRAASSSVTAPRAAAKSQPVYAPKCLCILSLHPYLEQYRVFLTELYRISLTPTRIPLERFIASFVLEIPLPPPTGDLKLRYSISNQLLEFARAPANKPLTYMHSTSNNRASRILTLFELLDLDNILFVFECLLLEKRILFLSSRLSLLTMVAEIFLHLMYPFQWSHVYIPLLPKALIDFLFAPMPFIIGMHHNYVRGHLQGEMLIDLVVVDLDKNKVHYSNNPHSVPGGGGLSSTNSPFANPSQPHATHPDQYSGHIHFFLPSKERKKLKLKLRPFQALFSRTSPVGSYVPAKDGSGKLSDAALRVEKPPHQAYQLRMLSELDLAFPNAAHPDELESIETYSQLVQDLQAQEEEISLAFFRCFVSMFQHYREYLIHPTPENPQPDPPFRWKEFLKKTGVTLSAGNANGDQVEEFYTAFSKTQAWQKFCEERIYATPIPGGAPSGVTSPTGASSSSPAAAATPLTPASAALLSREALSILFFDESILAKRNRSMFSSLTKKSLTPFLDLPVLEQRVVVIPGPEECNLPPPVEVGPNSALSPSFSAGLSGQFPSPSSTGSAAGGLSSSKKMKPYQFSYATFPDVLDESLFWGERIRPPAKQVKQVASTSATSAGATSITSPEHERRRSINQSGVLQPSSSSALAASSARPVDSSEVLETTWFILLSSLASSFRSGSLLKVGLKRLREKVEKVEKARAKAGATWRSVEGLPQPPPEDVFLRMMRACGACSLPELATDIFQTMLLRLGEYKALEDRATPQAAAMYTLLLSIHSMTNDGRGVKEGLTKLKSLSVKQRGGSSEFSSPNPATRTVETSFPQSPIPSTTSSFATPSSSQVPQSPTLVGGPVFHPSPPQQQREQGREEDQADASSAPVSEKEAGAMRGAKRPNAISTASTLNGVFTSGATLGGTKRVLEMDDDEVDALLADGNAGSSSKPMDHTLRLSFYQQQFKLVFPGLTVDLLDSCPECSRPLTDEDIRAGWSKEKENDYTTECPCCKERFVARFTVRPVAGATVPANPTPSLVTVSPFIDLEGDHVDHQVALEKRRKAEAAAGVSSAASLIASPLDASANISCEYLPPLVLRKEVTRVIDTYTIAHIASSAFQTTSPALFWNLIWHLTNLRLPVDFIVSPDHYLAPPTPSAKRKSAKHSAAAAAAAAKKPAKPSVVLPAQAASAVPLATLMAAAKSQPSASSSLPSSSAASLIVDRSTPAKADVALQHQSSTSGARSKVPLVAEADDSDVEDLSISISALSSADSATTDEEDDLAAELGSQWTSELPNSPGFAGILSPDAPSQAEQAAALREQFRAEQKKAANAQPTASNSPRSSLSSVNPFDFDSSAPLP